MGKSKQTQYKPRRTPASPAKVSSTADKIAGMLIDLSNNESDRVMAAVSAINGDHEALTFYSERIDGHAQEDVCSSILRDPDATDVSIESNGKGKITRIVKERRYG